MVSEIGPEFVRWLFFVLNKIDYLDEGELEEALSFYKRVLTKEAGWSSEFPVFCVSARIGLESKTAANPNGWAASGMAQLESFLVDFLAREKLNTLMDAVSRTYKKSVKTDIQQAWAKAIPDFFEQQQAELNERVKARLLECLTPHDQRVSLLVETLRHTAADLFRVPYRPLLQEETLEIKRRPHWVLNTWNTDPLPMLQSLDQRLDGLVRRNVENIRWSMLQNLNISFAGFARRTRERLDETVAATQGAMQATHTRRKGQGENIESDLIRMGDRISVLEELKTDFAVLRSGAPVC